MKKAIRILIIIILIMLFLIFLLKGYEKEQKDIAARVGPKIGGGELTMVEYYSLVQILDTYNEYLTQHDFETAYSMLNNNYKSYVPYTEYQAKVSKRNNDVMRVTDVERITFSTYKVTTDYSGDKEVYSIVFDENNSNFTLLPESFLLYEEPEIKASKKGMKCVLKEYVVQINQCICNLEITNNTGKEMSIKGATLYTNLEDELPQELDIVIPPKETKSCSITFDTDYAFPSKLILKRNDNGKKEVEYLLKISE